MAVAVSHIMTIGRVGLVGMMLLTSLACGSSLGTHNDGAVGGTGGTGGTGSGDASPVPPPSCLLDLIATCPLAGACQYSGDNGIGQRFCLAGGETISVAAIADGTAPMGGTVTEVRRGDGTLCYSIEKRCGPFCESTYYTWKDAAGAVVAHGLDSGISSSNTSSAMATCDATGETCNGNTPTAEPPECITGAVSWPPAALGCTQGSCP